jgi:ribosome-binding protein aMBF1 (putative translation factor)
MDGQDWDIVRIQNQANVRAMTQAGGAPRSSNEAAHAAKVAAAETPGRIKTLTPEAVRAIQDYRRANELTQKQLDQKCSFPPNTLQTLEARKTGPTPRQLQVLNQLLKTGLTLG